PQVREPRREPEQVEGQRGEEVVEEKNPPDRNPGEELREAGENDEGERERAGTHCGKRAPAEGDQPAPEKHDIAGVVDVRVVAARRLSEVPVDRLEHERPAPPRGTGRVRSGEA